MKRLISIVCVLVIALQTGCASQKKISNDNSVGNNLLVEPGDVGPSFLLKNGNLYGWTSKNNRDDSYLVNKNNLILMSDVESFKYQDSVWDNMHSNDYGAMMLYVKKLDGSFWMRGYDIEASFDENVIHNYKEFTKVLDNVKNYYKKTGSAVYVIKEDNSLWYWAKNGVKINGEKEYDFFKVMDDVKSVSVGASADYILKTDDSLWAVDSRTLIFQRKYPFDESPKKIMDDVAWCNVEEYIWGDYQQTAACDNNGNLWYWINEGKKQKKNAVPKIVAENVTKYVKYGDSESAFPDVYYRNDNSAFVVGSKREVIELGSDVKNAFCYNNEYGTKHDEFYILHTNGELYKFNPIKNKKVLINSNVKDFCSSGQVEDLWILKEDNSLVNYKGKVFLENVNNIYMSESIQFGNLIAIADNKVYELFDKGPKLLFELVD